MKKPIIIGTLQVPHAVAVYFLTPAFFVSTPQPQRMLTFNTYWASATKSQLYILYAGKQQNSA